MKKNKIKKLKKRKRIVKKAVKKKKPLKSRLTQSRTKPMIRKKPAKKGKITLKETAEQLRKRADNLVAKGRQRGFVTYMEILKEFPAVENDLIFLEDLYNRFEEVGVDILEEGSLLEENAPLPEKLETRRGGDSSLDSVQMYLKEI